MAFRNIKSRVPRETSTATLVELVDDEFKAINLNMPLPSSTDYSLKDMLAAGVKVQPVDPTVIHDSSATSAVADALVSQPVTSDNVEPSNNG